MQSSQTRPVSGGSGVIAAFHAPARRISLAIALSLLLHAAILWLPHVHLPHEKVNLPPLTARLEPRPAPAAEKPAAKPETEPITLTGNAGSSLPDKERNTPVKSIPVMEKTAQSRPFPKHLQITFSVYAGADLSSAGELEHLLDIDNDNYSLRAIRQSSGLSAPRNYEQLVQSSYGKIDEHGLRPAIFREEKFSQNGKQNLEATFDWSAQKLRLAQGGEIHLPANTQDIPQDILSFMYQFSQLSIPSMGVEFFPVTVSDGVQLQQYQVEIGAKEEIATPMGKMRALHLRKMHGPGEAYFEIWLGLEYRMLPVKIRQVDGADKVLEESVISDIRAEE